MDFVFDRAKRSLACVFSCYSTTTRIYTVMLSNFEYRYHDFFPSIIPMSQVCTIFSRHMQILQGSHVSMCAVPEGSDDGAAVPVDPHLPNASRRYFFCHPLPAARTSQTPSYVAVQVERVSLFSKRKSFTLSFVWRVCVLHADERKQNPKNPSLRSTVRRWGWARP